ncbi:outer membrane protein assembly factor BamB [Ramlibacter sp. MAH-25]|uniref:Outer membrane protein assembly factor BamB n=2 Tax=Comamonadaceae TaxID=80864 RepID=A0A6N8INA1_9BURK|nr:outer membrane protein assembly factor BamB [Ramlibacter sp. CGMCC 1.13660]MVQ28162.1 outer membrane protein assembly factor BamB [Ramlibacter pinisoli]
MTAGRIGAAAVLAASLLGLAGCSMMPSFLGGSDKAAPPQLEPNPGLLAVRQAWTTKLGEVGFPMTVAVNGTQLALASSDGTVAMLDAGTGRELWRAGVGSAIVAGAGSDGTTLAVVTRDNELVAASAGKVLWRQKLAAQAYTAPLVAGNRVFVLAADRSVSAFDGQSGRRLWSQPRPGEPLVLRQSGVLLAVGDTLLAGQGGRVVGLNPNNGSVRWDAAIATPRGTNDVERLVDLVGRPSRVGNSVCVRAFQASVGCLDATRGGLAWTKPSNGGDGLGGDDRLVVGTESDGRVVAWRRDNGERAWTTDKLLHRGTGTPLLVGNSVAVGDSTGLLHVLSREDGKLLTRLTTDGSPVVAPPVIAGSTLVVVTRNGGVYGFVPQ